MTSDSQITDNGPRYALAIYDGPRHVGFLPRQGGPPIRGETVDGSVDLFYSELGVRSQARVRAIVYAPLTVAPYDLRGRRPLDPIPMTEDDPMALKDEDARDLMTNRSDQKESFDSAMLADLHRSNVRAGLSPVVLVLAEAQRELVRLVTRLMPDGNGRFGGTSEPAGRPDAG